MAQDWTREEVEIIVAAYFEMFTKEQAGTPYKKSEVRRRIMPLLNNRSEASIEFKNRNISAALVKMNEPYVRGYIPAYNYQKILLEEVIFSHLRQKPEIENSFKLFADSDVTRNVVDFENILEPTPTKENFAQEPEIAYRSPIKINYIEKEQRNRAIGAAGEGIAYEYEKRRLIVAGKENLAEEIEWVSQTRGDGLGYDILSRNINGTDRYIEVKSTKLTKEAPFYFSALEFDFSKRNSSNFYLYRVFNLNDNPKLFIANGPYDGFCKMNPIEFKGSF